MICKNCKYFYLERIDFIGGHRFEGRCKNPLLVADGYVPEHKKGVAPNGGICATCDEGRGELIVDENFGCIHFEQKV